MQQRQPPEAAEKDFTQTLAKLGQAYVASSLERVAAATAVVDSLSATELGEAQRQALLDTLQSTFHAFAGSGGMWGMPEVSRRAREAEMDVQAARQGGADASAGKLELWHDSLADIRAELEALHPSIQRPHATQPQPQQADGASSGPAGPSAGSLPGPAPDPASVEGAEIAAGAVGQAVWPVRVLIADDDPAVRDLLRHHLKREGWSVVAANDGEQAAQALKTEHFDLVLLDVSMPFLSGFDLLRSLQESAGAGAPNVVLLTAQSHEQAQIRAFDLGADDFVAKPFSPAVLVSRLRRLVDARR